MWVYIQSEPSLWTVGFYDPSGKWHTDSDHDSREKAAERVAYLNGEGSARIAQQMATVILNPKVDRHIPFGLKEQVIEWLKQ
jgi:hypothetical protein